MYKESFFEKYRTYILAGVITFVVVMIAIGAFVLGKNTDNKTVTTGPKGMIVLKENMIANKIEKKDSFVLLTCNSTSGLCSDLYKKIEKSDIVDEYQVVFLDLYSYTENIKSTEDAVQRKEYIDKFNQLKARYNIKKLPTIQTYKEGILDKNKSDIFSEDYLKKNQEEQGTELQNVINDIKNWLSK